MKDLGKGVLLNVDNDIVEFARETQITQEEWDKDIRDYRAGEKVSEINSIYCFKNFLNQYMQYLPYLF